MAALIAPAVPQHLNYRNWASALLFTDSISGQNELSLWVESPGENNEKVRPRELVLSDTLVSPVDKCALHVVLLHSGQRSSHQSVWFSTSGCGESAFSCEGPSLSAQHIGQNGHYHNIRCEQASPSCLEIGNFVLSNFTSISKFSKRTVQYHIDRSRLLWNIFIFNP